MEPGEGWPLWAVALQDSPLGLAIRHSTWIYPFGNIIHVLGMGLFVGSILILDFRFLGLGRKRISIDSAVWLFTPFVVTGLVLLVPGGLILFIADAGPLAANSLLQIKLALVAIGIANAVLFRFLWSPRLSSWDKEPPNWGRVQVAASILIWLAVPVFGRLIAYL